jgi:primosomal protein N' (replication factor Y) (superfamily II helicase)
LDTFDSRQTLFIQVLLPLNLGSTFTYRVPYELNEEIIIGKRVSVPFGKSKVMAGLIFSISESPPNEYQAKYILDVLDNESIVHSFQLKLWVWMAHYYMTSIGLVYNAAMPAGLKLDGESKLVLNPEFEHNVELDPKEYLIIETLKTNKELSITQAASLLKIKQIHKYIHSLYLKGGVLLKEDINEVYKPKVVNYISIPVQVQQDKQLNILFDELEKRAPKQLQALMTFIAKYGSSGETEKTELVKHDLTNSAINALIDKGVFVQESRTISRLTFTNNLKEVEALETEQEEAYHQIQMAFLDRKPALLFGVTGSGKTHIYSKLIQDNLINGKQVLYLLPEIALTSQLIDRLQQYFGEQLLVSHSKFSNNERVEVYKAINSGKPQLIVGTRSAIFQPFQNLGLIIVDEEHESSFKQSEPAPRFNARDTALYVASQTGANIVLGSATPAVESYFNATVLNKYKLVPLTKRFDGAIMPRIEVINMQEQKKQKRIRGIFSDTLLEAIADAKNREKQVILFQNKKGYVPVLECNVCSWTPKCQNCDISLTFYKYQENLRCHYCGYTQEVVSQCELCNNKGIELIGYGTERIEDELTLYMPELRVKRMDQNTTRLKNAHTKLIHEFAAGKIDVLIGTQMVAKGLDFENVSTVGILNADHLINFPDFRANERAYQLMTQVAGRAGRRKEQGKVYIQTSKPEHYVIQQIVNHDYTAMYNNDIAERKSFDYPPYFRLVKISLKHKDPLLLSRLGNTVKLHLIAYFGKSLLGPEKPYVSKIRNWYILNFVLKVENNSRIVNEQKKKLEGALQHLNKQKDFSQAKIIVDVDPM